MADDLKERVLELAEIAKQCPENLQAKCFELLLEDLLASRADRAPAKPALPPARATGNEPDQPPEPRPDEPPLDESNQQDVKITDLHMKARKFLQKYSLSMDHVNALFYKEGAELKPLYEDLKTTRMAEGQIRIALLQALVSGMTTGEFEADGEKVRAECTTRKCYDLNNFAANFKKNGNLFDGFEKYEKGTPLRLSEDGRKELAEVIKELEK